MALAAFGVVGASVVTPEQALAANECGAQVNDGATDARICGSPPSYGSGITYVTNDPLQLLLVNTQVTGGGVLVTGAGADESVLIETSLFGVGPAPVITNNAGLNAEAGIEVRTTGLSAFVTINHNAGAISRGGGFLATHPGIFVSTTGASAPIEINTAAGTTVTLTTGLYGIGMVATGGANVTSIVDGTVTNSSSLAGTGLGFGVSGSAALGGSVDLTVGETTGAVTGSAAGLYGTTSGSGNVTLDVAGSVTQSSATAASLGGLIVPFGVGGLASGTGNVIITTQVGSTVTQNGALPIAGIEGIGVAGVNTGTGNTTITANGAVSATGIGVVGTTTSGNAIVTVGGGVSVTGATGPSPFIDPILINSGATVGALAVSDTGAATVNLFGNILGSTPDIGLSSIVLGGAADATINIGDGTLNPTVTANIIGLYGVNFGTGNVVVNNVNGQADAPIAVGTLALTGNSLVTNSQSGVMNGAVVMVSGNDNILDNETDSQINIPAVSGIVMLAAQDNIVNNNTGSDMNFAGPLSFNIMLAGRDSIINNADDGTTFNVNGPISANIMIAGHDATINNSNGAAFNLNGALTANLMLAGHDATINNFYGADFNLLGALNGNIMVADHDVNIDNYDGGAFNLLGALNGNFMIAGRDATIDNYNGGAFNLLGALNGNFMDADHDAIINNYNGGAFNLLGALNGNFMDADHDAVINNYNGGTFTLAGLANGNFMFADRDALIDNYDGGTLNLLGLNGNLMVADRDAIIDNYDGGTINLIGVNTLGFIADNSTINNYSVVNVSGFASFLGLDDFNNSGMGTGGLLDMRNGISDYGVANAPTYGNGIGDVTLMTGNFNGGTGSELGIDAFLRGPGADSSSDLLKVGGNVTGATALLVNDTNPGTGAYNPDGILFAHVEGDSPLGSFFLPNGPIDKGFFSYDIVRVEVNSFDWLLASTPNDRAEELPALITGAQTIWYEFDRRVARPDRRPAPPDDLRRCSRSPGVSQRRGCAGNPDGRHHRRCSLLLPAVRHLVPRFRRRVRSRRPDRIRSGPVWCRRRHRLCAERSEFRLRRLHRRCPGRLRQLGAGLRLDRRHGRIRRRHGRRLRDLHQ